MRINFYPLILLLVFSGANAQENLRQKADAYASRLVGLYNRSSFDSLYRLGGPLFQKRWPYEMYFRGKMRDQHSINGEIANYIFYRVADSTVYYKAHFKSERMDFGLTISREGKLEDFFLERENYVPPAVEALEPIREDGIEPDKTYVDSLMQAFMSRTKVAGLAVGILADGNFHTYNYGETVRGHNAAPTQYTLFEIGSISKTFTGILLANFVQQGKLKLDDPVNKYLPDSIPELSYNGKMVTLASLSNHSSGLPRLPGDLFAGADMQNPYKHYDDKRLFGFLKNYKLKREPGAQYEYSNLAAGLLGVVLERVSGKTYEQLLKQIITGPLGMQHTRITLTAADKAMFAQGYNGERPMGSWEFLSLVGAGGIRSCIADMLIYAKAQAASGNSTLDKAIALSHQETWSKNGTRVALGWHLVTKEGKNYIFHNGQTGGYNSVLLINPQSNNAVVMLTNTVADPMGTAMELMYKIDQ